MSIYTPHWIFQLLLSYIFTFFHIKAGRPISKVLTYTSYDEKETGLVWTHFIYKESMSEILSPYMVVANEGLQMWQLLGMTILDTFECNIKQNSHINSKMMF
jgi:hypothetical protein